MKGRFILRSILPFRIQCANREEREMQRKSRQDEESIRSFQTVFVPYHLFETRPPVAWRARATLVDNLNGVRSKSHVKAKAKKPIKLARFAAFRKDNGA